MLVVNGIYIMGLRIIQNFFSKFFEHKQQKTQNFCLVLAEKGHHEFIPLPINLDFAAHLSEYNPDRYGFGVEHPFVQDKALFFLGLLSSIPAMGILSMLTASFLSIWLQSGVVSRTLNSTWIT